MEYNTKNIEKVATHMACKMPPTHLLNMAISTFSTLMLSNEKFFHNQVKSYGLDDTGPVETRKQ